MAEVVVQLFDSVLCEVCNKYTTKRCIKCKKVKYCSQECQAKDWVWHKLSCGKKYDVINVKVYTISVWDLGEAVLDLVLDPAYAPPIIVTCDDDNEFYLIPKWKGTHHIGNIELVFKSQTSICDWIHSLQFLGLDLGEFEHMTYSHDESEALFARCCLLSGIGFKEYPFKYARQFDPIHKVFEGKMITSNDFKAINNAFIAVYPEAKDLLGYIKEGASLSLVNYYKAMF